MALHSIDGTINKPDIFGHPVTSGTAWMLPVVDGNAQAIPQILIGMQKDGFGVGKDFGIKVSRQGVDVRTANDVDLVMSSAFKNFKIVAKGNYTVFKPGSVDTVSASVLHGLGYTPFVLMFASYSGGNSYVQTPLISVDTTSGIIDFLAFCTVDNTSITFNVRAPQNGSLYNFIVSTEFFYYLFVETAN
jgi:hypothetical protein